MCVGLPTSSPKLQCMNILLLVACRLYTGFFAGQQMELPPRRKDIDTPLLPYMLLCGFSHKDLIGDRPQRANVPPPNPQKPLNLGHQGTDDHDCFLLLS
jgi:hypothetical protein